jgi:hypothetical protein
MQESCPGIAAKVDIMRRAMIDDVSISIDTSQTIRQRTVATDQDKIPCSREDNFAPREAHLTPDSISSGEFK